MKKIISVLITISIVFNMSIFALALDYGEELANSPDKVYQQSFSDVSKDHWAFSYISEMSERGVLSGYPDGKFYPESQVTRAEFSKIMTIAAGLSIAEVKSQIYKDVDINAWYAPYIHAAKDYMSAFKQNENYYFKPNSPALREDIAVALVKLKGYSTLGADMTTVTRMFSDFRSISEGARIYVASAIENGLISGYQDGTFRGQNGITRAEAATLLWRAYQYGNSNKVYDTPSSNPVTDNPITSVPSVENKKPSETEKTEESEADESENNEEAIESPYIIKKLASANPTSYSHNNESIYYIDKSDKAIYKVNIYDETKTAFFNTSDLKYELENKESTASEYSEFVPTQVYCDNVNSRILLLGYYTKLIKPFQKPTSGQWYFIYDISNQTDNVLMENIYFTYGGSGYRPRNIQCVLDEDRIAIKTIMQNTICILDTTNRTLSGIDLNMKMDYISGLVCDNYMYGLFNNTGYYNKQIWKYDFSSNNCEVLSNLDFTSYGIKDEFYYFWDKITGEIIKISMKNGKTTVLDINTDSKNVDYKDLGNMSNIATNFLIIDDNTIIFYDNNMQAFRILKENNS